jgi:tetratricopeptide (TPR) repeat protein
MLQAYEAKMNSMPSQGINTECAICLSDKIEQPVILEACHHAFCLKCITSWQRLQRPVISTLRPTQKHARCVGRTSKRRAAADALLEKAFFLSCQAVRHKASAEDKERYNKESLAIINGFIDAAGDVPNIDAIFSKSFLFKDMGEYEEAIALADKVILLNKERRGLKARQEALLKLSQEAFMRDDFDEVERICAEVSRNSGIPYLKEYKMMTQLNDMYILQAQCHQGLKEWRKAIDLYERILPALKGNANAVEILPSEGNFPSFLWLGSMHVRSGRFREMHCL